LTFGGWPRWWPPRPRCSPRSSSPAGTALRQGLITSLANPKLAVFFVALFPQFGAGQRAGAAERLTRGVLVALGVRLAFERR
jgi:threonine/homoserine/homoserine lactone efflux protein